MAEPMRIRATVVGDKVDVKILMQHAMETGLRKDAKGASVAPHFIQNVLVTHNGRTVLPAQWETGVSKNPFLHFRFRGGKSGKKVIVTWNDNQGDKRTDEATIVGG
jgi:sulfur-oxidizing protein SoxZ